MCTVHCSYIAPPGWGSELRTDAAMQDCVCPIISWAIIGLPHHTPSPIIYRCAEMLLAMHASLFWLELSVVKIGAVRSGCFCLAKRAMGVHGNDA